MLQPARKQNNTAQGEGNLFSPSTHNGHKVHKNVKIKTKEVKRILRLPLFCVCIIGSWDESYIKGSFVGWKETKEEEGRVLF